MPGEHFEFSGLNLAQQELFSFVLGRLDPLAFVDERKGIPFTVFNQTLL